MARRYELIVFDWDGTILDSAAAIVHAICAAARDMGVVEPSETQARYVIGLGLRDAMQQSVPTLPEKAYAIMVERYRHHYLAKDNKLQVFSGIESLLVELRQAGYMLAIATGKSRAGLLRALELSGLEQYFDATRCADECHSKPHPQMLHELIDDLGTTAATSLMIGDTSHDILMAKNAGVDVLAVSYGAHARDALLSHDPLAVLATVSDLSIWLQQNA